MTRIRREIHAAVLVLALTGCASTPAPTGLLDQADAAIDAARLARAEDHAPVELGFAQEKLAAARVAMDKREYGQAQALAEQAELNASLAAARSRAAAGRAAVQQQTEENARLRRDLLGNDGGRP